MTFNIASKDVEQFEDTMMKIPDETRLQTVEREKSTGASTHNDDSFDNGGDPDTQAHSRKPWRAQTSYEIFCRKERQNLKQRLGEVGSREINKQLGSMWKSLSNE